METLSYCQWTFPDWFYQFSYFRGGLWNIFVLYRDRTLHGRFSTEWIICFTTFFIIFNLVLLALACWTGYK